MNEIIHSRRGQTLVEALVALSILTVGFAGIVTLLNRSFELNRTTTDDTQATYLASEGIEIAKNIIDYDVYYGLGQSTSTIDWGCSFDQPLGQPVDYALEYDTSPTQCATPALVSTVGDKLYFDPATDLYTYSNIYTPTDFTRDVYITAVADPSTPNNSYEFDVLSVVTWTAGATSNTVKLEDHFYNWYPPTQI
jgi:hypothetical protein